MTDQTTMTEGISADISTLYVCIALAMIFLSLLCNLIVMATVYSCKDSNSPKDWLILNISLCDIVSTLFSTLSIDNIFMKWNVSDSFCKASYALSYAGFAATVLSLCVMSVERYYGICRPVDYQKRCLAKKLRWSIPGIWLLSIALFAVYFGVYGTRTIQLADGKTGRVCDETWDSLYGKIYYTIFPCILLTVVASAFMTIVLVKILRKLRVSRTPSSGGSAVLNIKRKGTVKMIFVMFLVHYLCWLSTIVLKLLNAYGTILPRYWIMLAFFDLPHYARSIFYTVIYCFMYPGFSGNLKSICAICWCCVTRKTTPRRNNNNENGKPTSYQNNVDCEDA